jgi:hypothetical protein
VPPPAPLQYLSKTRFVDANTVRMALYRTASSGKRNSTRTYPKMLVSALHKLIQKVGRQSYLMVRCIGVYNRVCASHVVSVYCAVLDGSLVILLASRGVVALVVVVCGARFGEVGEEGSDDGSEAEEGCGSRC